MAVITAFSIKWAQNNIPQIKEVGSVIGTAVSGGFLVLIGILNLYIWFDILHIFFTANLYNNNCSRDIKNQLYINLLN